METSVLLLAVAIGAIVGILATVLILKSFQTKGEKKEEKKDSPRLKFKAAASTIPEQKDQPEIVKSKSGLRRMDTPYNPATNTSGIFKKRNPFKKGKLTGLGSLSE